MKAAEVDEGVGTQEEVGDDGGDGVQLRWRGGGVEEEEGREDDRRTLRLSPCGITACHNLHLARSRSHQSE